MSVSIGLFQIKDISTYRSELMAWSILWIMMLHFTFTQIKPFGFIAQYGFVGVDIFMLVSGLGLYFSLENKKLIDFYKKRIFRIFPTYYLIGLLYNIILFHDDILTYLYRFTTLGYWTGGVFGEWYIPTIVLYYLFSPLIKKVFDRRWPFILTILGSISLFSIGLSWYLCAKQYPMSRLHFFSIYRINSFLFGMLCAYWLKKGISTKTFLCFLILGIPLFIHLFPLHHQIYNYKYLSLFFLLPSFTVCLIMLSKWLKIIGRLLKHLGTSSLEIYLIQDILFRKNLFELLQIPNEWHDATTITLICISCMLGMSIHWLINRSRITRAR